MGNYRDIDDNPTTLDKLCRTEPAWAASLIRAELAKVDRLTEALAGLVGALPRCENCGSRNVIDPSDCPRKQLHTKCPEGYVEWHFWAEQMRKTHRQTRCAGCGRWAIWERTGGYEEEGEGMSAQHSNGCAPSSRHSAPGRTDNECREATKAKRPRPWPGA